MECVVQATKVLRNLVDAETSAGCPKTGFCAFILFSLRDY